MDSENLSFIKALQRDVQFLDARLKVTLLEKNRHDFILRGAAAQIVQCLLQATPNPIA